MLYTNRVPDALLTAFDSSALDAVINAFDLYSTYPVNLTPVCDYLNIRLQVGKLPPAFNAVSFVKRGGSKITILVSDSLELPTLRAAIGHELGHIFKHEAGQAHASFDLEAALATGSYRGCSGQLSKYARPGQRVSREETEADLMGAYLTVPAKSMLELFQQGFDLEQVAATLELPIKSIELRAQLIIAKQSYLLEDSQEYNKRV